MVLYNMIERCFSNYPLKCVQIDAGREFTGVTFIKFLADKEIRRRLSCPNTPEQNGIVERKHGHIANVGRCFLHQAKLPLHFWSDAYSSATFVINRTPSNNTQGMSPYELLYNHSLDLNLLKIFGCQCFPIIPRI